MGQSLHEKNGQALYECLNSMYRMKDELLELLKIFFNFKRIKGAIYIIQTLSPYV